MIGRLIALSARNVLLVLLATLFLTGAGIWARARTRRSMPCPISPTRR